MKIVKLGDVISLQNGFAFKSKEYSSDGYFIMRITNVKKGYISNHNPRYFKIKSHKHLEKFILKENDILMSLTGNVGRIGIIKKEHLPCVLNQRVAKIDVIDETILNKDFLFLFLNSDIFIKEVEKIAHGTAQDNVSTKDISNINFNLPSLEEQHLIAAKLNSVHAEINKVKENTETKIKNTKKFFENYLVKVFEKNKDWTHANLKELTTKIGSGSTPRGGNKSYKSFGTSLIRSMNVHDKGFDYNKLAFIDDEQANKLNIVNIENDDVLINITGASVARCCIVPNDVLPARVNQHVSILRAKKNILYPNFLHFILISPNHKNKLLKTGEDGGATRQAITKNQLEKYKIHFPKNYNLQTELVKKIVSTQSLVLKIKSIYEKKLKNLIQLKQSILKQELNNKII